MTEKQSAFAAFVTLNRAENDAADRLERQAGAEADPLRRGYLERAAREHRGNARLFAAKSEWFRADAQITEREG
jgi:hypothetical protein